MIIKRFGQNQRKKAKNLHYAPSMMSQKHMCASWVLSRKEDKMVWIFGEVGFEENDVCFKGASYYVG